MLMFNNRIIRPWSKLTNTRLGVHLMYAKIEFKTIVGKECLALVFELLRCYYQEEKYDT